MRRRSGSGSLAGSGGLSPLMATHIMICNHAPLHLVTLPAFIASLASRLCIIAWHGMATLHCSCKIREVGALQERNNMHVGVICKQAQTAISSNSQKPRTYDMLMHINAVYCLLFTVFYTYDILNTFVLRSCSQTTTLGTDPQMGDGLQHHPDRQKQNTT
jgi:hypothetical protein